MLGIQPKFQTYEKQKNRENKAPKEKQSHAHDSIYVVQQFAYVHKVAGISLLSKKITMCGYNAFLSQKQQQDKTLITKKKKKKKMAFISCAQDSQCATKRAKKFLSAQASAPWTKPQ